jgi:hypothetical protein
MAKLKKAAAPAEAAEDVDDGDGSSDEDLLMDTSGMQELQSKWSDEDESD